VINYASYHFGERTCLHLDADIFLSITFSAKFFLQLSGALLLNAIGSAKSVAVVVS
jgi:hypothetical protein